MALDGMLCRKKLGPNEVDTGDLKSLPNASQKDSESPPIQQYAKTPKKQVAHPRNLGSLGEAIALHSSHDLQIINWHYIT